MSEVNGMALEQIRQMAERVRESAKSPVFLLNKDKYLCILWPTTKDRAGTPYTRQKNRRLV